MSDRADELHQQLRAKVTKLRSSEEWLQAMTAAARFHDYSLGNWLLLWSQAEQRGTKVTRPAGYRTWQSMGRQVRRGERGYQILVPMIRPKPLFRVSSGQSVRLRRSKSTRPLGDGGRPSGWTGARCGAMADFQPPGFGIGTR
jgi:hypothetical protein